MISFFKKKIEPIIKVLHADMHSHLLAGVDDGVKSHEDAITIIERFHHLGYKKIITTPHIMSDYYPNNPSDLLVVSNELNVKIKERNLPIELQFAAEYYLDENVFRDVSSSKRLLTIGEQGYLLFETNFFAEPYQLNEFIFNAITQGYKPILAHPERYQYMSLQKAEDLRNRGVLLQVNIPSIVGYYGKPVEKMAIKLIENGYVDFLGSDCHNLLQCKLIEDAFQNRNFKKALDLPLLNNTI